MCSGRGHQDAVDVFPVEDAAIVAKRLQARHNFFGLIEAAIVDIRDRDHLKIRDLERLL